MLAGSDWASIVVGALAMAGVIFAAMANSRGRKQERATGLMDVQVLANNQLLDQLQESLKDYREENIELRERISMLDQRVVELTNELQALSDERDRLKRLVDAQGS